MAQAGYRLIGCRDCGESFRFQVRDGRPPVRCEPCDAPRLCAYFTGFCSDCGAGIGGRARRLRCVSCAREAKLSSTREASAVIARAQHRARARVVTCSACGCQFCPLYGHSKGTGLCDPCRPDWRLTMKRARKALRSRRIREGAERESIVPRVVFDRDGWTCQRCGEPTPESLRGTTDPHAPEVDHVVPLARGGSHTYRNVQCLCRACNVDKGSSLPAVLDGAGPPEGGRKSLRTAKR